MLIHRKLAACCLLGAFVAAGTAGAFARSGGGFTRSEAIQVAEILRHLRVLERQAAIPSALTRREAFDLLLDEQAYPGTCATPLLIALEQSRPSLPEKARGLIEMLGPGGLGGLRELVGSPAPLPGSFRLLYRSGEGTPGAIDPTDGDLDGTPDEARALLDRLDEAKEAVAGLLDRTGTPIPWPEADEPVHDAIVADLPWGIGGYVWSHGTRTVLLMDREAVMGPGGDDLLRHQITHLIQTGLTGDEPPWWYEAHAVWAEDPSGARAGLRAAAVAAYLAGSRHGIGTDRVAAWEGSLLWPHYLARTGDDGRAIGLAWEEMAAVPGENLAAAFESALTRLRGSSLAEEVRAFRIWNVFLGELDDGNHYPFASALSSAVGSEVGSYPVSWHGRGPLAPLGGEMIQLAARAAAGGWLLEFEGEEGTDWDLSLITVPVRRGAGPRLAEIEAPHGRGSAGVPWRDLAAVIVVVQNLGGERTEPSRFSFHARQDPLVPFDLMSFAPEQEEDAVALRWHTEREIDMLGWRVYRSGDPVSGFTPINTFLIPAAGGPGIASYIFLDSDAAPGRKYYYLLEGVTRHGFTEVTHPISIRVHPPASGSGRN